MLVQDILASLDWRTLLYYAAPVMAVALIANIIYLRHFHPLAGFPGPFLASITNIYAVYMFFTWRMEELEADLHKKYGPIVRLQPHYLSFSSPEALPIIFNRTADKDPDYYFSAGLGIGPSTFSSITHQTHAFFRKRVAAAFNMSSALRLTPIVTERLTTFHSVLSRFARSGETFDFCVWIEFAAYDIISHVAFGGPFGFLERGEDIHGLARAKELGLPLFGIASKIPFVRMLLCSPLLSGMLPKPTDTKGIGAAMGVRDRLLNERLELLKTGKPVQSDLLQYLLDIKNPDGTPITITEVKDELLTVMLAGSDTISSNIWITVKRVLETPRVYHALMEELRSANLSRPIPQYQELLDLPYFQAVLKEILRVDPGGPLYLPRLVPKGGYTIHGKFIPEGYKVGFNPYVTNRDKTFWGEDAEEFRPERWLGLDAKEVRRLESMMGSWGYGSRVCMGKPLALVELAMTSAMIFVNFRPELVDLDRQGKRRNLANVMMKGLWMKMHPLE